LVVASGTTCVLDANVAGSIVVEHGANLDVENATITGSVVAVGADTIRLCGDTITNSLTVQNAFGFVLVGDPANGCAANSVGGSITVTGNTAGLIMIDNTYGDTFTATGNSGAGPLPGETGPVIQGNKHT
jgi:hypothetical protein